MNINTAGHHEHRLARPRRPLFSVNEAALLVVVWPLAWFVVKAVELSL